jgi:hypothetical protein
MATRREREKEQRERGRERSVVFVMHDGGFFLLFLLLLFLCFSLLCKAGGAPTLSFASSVCSQAG